MPYYVKGLPKLTSLTSEQRAAIKDSNNLALSGGPGTGKSLVSIFRHLYNHQKYGDRCHLITFHNSLANYLKLLVKNIQSQENDLKNLQNAGSTIHTTTDFENKIARSLSAKLQEVIVDEAQDNKIKFYDILNEKAVNISYGADIKQSLQNNNEIAAQLRSVFPGNNEYTLFENFRNTYEIMLFTKSILKDFLIPQYTIDSLANRKGSPPEVYINNDNRNRDKAVISKVMQNYGKAHNIGIIVKSEPSAFYFYELISNLVDSNKEKFADAELSFYKTINLGNIHISTSHSAKGFEFDTVILPDFEFYHGNELEENLNYISITRARQNILIISKNDFTKQIPDYFDGKSFKKTWQYYNF